MPKWNENVTWRQLTVVLALFTGLNGAVYSFSMRSFERIQTSSDAYITKRLSDICEKIDLKYAKIDVVSANRTDISMIRQDILYIKTALEDVRDTMKTLVESRHKGGP